MQACSCSRAKPAPKGAAWRWTPRSGLISSFWRRAGWAARRNSSEPAEGSERPRSLVCAGVSGFRVTKGSKVGDITMRPERPRAWANWAMVPPGRSVSIRREVLLPLGWPHQGFSPGGNEGCDRSLGVQLPPLDGWSFEAALGHLRVPSSSPSVSFRFRDWYGQVIALPCAQGVAPQQFLNFLPLRQGQ